MLHPCIHIIYPCAERYLAHDSPGAIYLQQVHIICKGQFLLFDPDPGLCRCSVDIQ